MMLMKTMVMVAVSRKDQGFPHLKILCINIYTNFTQKSEYKPARLGYHAVTKC